MNYLNESVEEEEGYYEPATMAEAEGLDQLHVTKMAKDKRLRDFKKAVWQYLADHTTPHKRGHVIRFVVRSEQDFWWRVDRRRAGKFKRNDTRRIATLVDSIIYGVAKRSHQDKMINEWWVSGPWWLRGVLKIRSLLNQWVERRAQAAIKGQEFPLYQTHTENNG